MGLANVPPTTATTPAPVQGLGLAKVAPVKGLGLANLPPPTAPAKASAHKGPVINIKVPPPTPAPAPPQDSGLANVPPPAAASKDQEAPTNQVEDTLKEISNKKEK